MKLFSLLENKFSNFLTAARNYLSQALSNYGDNYGNSTIFGQLINVLGGVVQNVMLYLEDSLTEQNKWTAQRKKSIYGLAAQSGYQPDFGSATGVQLLLRFIPNNQQTLNVIIHNREQLTCTQNGLKYNIILPQEALVLDVTKDPTPKYLYAVEGTFDSQTFVSRGGQYYTQNFQFDGNVDVKYMTVAINDEEWEYVPSIYDMDPQAKQYTYTAGFSGGIDLIFGNGEHGMPLADGDVIKVTYLMHDGEMGNLSTDVNTYFSFDGSITDISGEVVDGNNIFVITLSTVDGVTSGSDTEDIDSVRQNIGFNSRSLVLASPDNYKHFLNKYSFVGYNRTWSERGSLIVNTLAMKNYKLNLDQDIDYFNLREEDFLLSHEQKQSIINAVTSSGNQLAGITYNIIDPEICKYFLTVYIKMKSDKYDRLYTENAIKNSVAKFFANIVSDQFIPTSDIERTLLDEVEGIDGVNCYFLSEKNETALQNQEYTTKTYVWNNLEGKYDIKEETVHLFPGENPHLGLDSHGNILLTSDHEFPVLMGGWDYLTVDEDGNPTTDEIYVNEPLNIIFE